MKTINTKTAMAAYLEKERREILYRTSANDEQTKTRKLEALTAAEEAFCTDTAVIAIKNAIEDVEKMARVRTITAEKLIETLADIDKTLGISKKAKEGIKISVDINAQKFPRAYKGIPESTQFTAEFKGGSWRITGIKRAQCRTARIVIEHTEASKAALIGRFTRF